MAYCLIKLRIINEGSKLITYTKLKYLVAIARHISIAVRIVLLQINCITGAKLNVVSYAYACTNYAVKIGTGAVIIIIGLGR